MKSPHDITDHFDLLLQWQITKSALRKVINGLLNNCFTDFTDILRRASLRWQNISAMECCIALYNTAIIKALFLQNAFWDALLPALSYMSYEIAALSRIWDGKSVRRFRGRKTDSEVTGQGPDLEKIVAPTEPTAFTQHSTRLPSFIPSYRQSSSALSISTTKFPKSPRTINSLQSKSISDQWNLT
jgi:hypothetical protein